MTALSWSSRLSDLEIYLKGLGYSNEFTDESELVDPAKIVTPEVYGGSMSKPPFLLPETTLDGAPTD
ncbi:hypothetical protein HK100_005132 [Physocladia obscura]|uniref:Uncharacterized protein n=1 Tax=Physocladia obscura TaxID=109957 RepID=A0AAD5SUI6_9FUNG|nr:hypothetical protein HK100_005132 [Physocladia obscura]